jgi:hypothetical protein
MARVNEPWAAIVAAIAAGFFGIGGTFAGLYVGRRQTTDQADVEHGQWLRGQRQEAYLNLLEAWDDAMQEIDSIVYAWEGQLYGDHDWRRQDDGFSGLINASVARVRKSLDRPLGRAHLLGPERVEAAVDGLRGAVDAVAVFLNGVAVKEDQAGPEDWEPWEGVLSGAQEARQGLVAAAKAVLDTAPRPGR